MPLYRTIDGTLREFSLQEAQEANEKCDVFVSHKQEDEDLALEVYRCIETYGLKPWIDIKDPTITGDGPDLDAKIQGIIVNSFSLLAVVSDATQHSWWVPFEVGIAFDEQCLLASFVKAPTDRLKLPSFLSKHPRLKNHSPDLHNWCEDIRDTKQRLGKAQPLMEQAARRVIRASTQTAYLREMRRMTNTYR